MNCKKTLAGILSVAIIGTSFSSVCGVFAKTENLEATDNVSVSDSMNNIETDRLQVKSNVANVANKNEFIIKDKDDFNKFLTDFNFWKADSTIKLVNDIDMNGAKIDKISKFCGKFDGNGKTVRNFKTEGKNGGSIIDELATGAEIENVTFEDYSISCNLNKEQNYAGLVTVNNGKISRVILNNCKLDNFIGRSHKEFRGGLCFENNGTIEDCTLKNILIQGCSSIAGFVYKNNGSILGCKVDANIGDRGAENVCGFVNDNFGEISKCESKSNITGYILSGFALYNYKKITDCQSQGKIKGNDSAGKMQYSVGGFAGNNSGTILTCTSKNTVEGGGGEKGKGCVGGFIGTNDYNGNIIECHYNGDTTGYGECTGGFVGKNLGNITNSDSAGSVTAATDYDWNICSSGGFVGINDKGSIKNSKSYGNVTGQEYVGGFVGQNKAAIENSTAKGNATASTKIHTNYCGGFVGINNSGSIKSNEAYGNATGQEYVGGFVGQNKAAIENSTAKGNATASTDVHTNYCGGFVGVNNNGSIKSSNAYGSATGDEYVGGFAGMNKATIENSTANGNAKAYTRTHGSEAGGFVGSNKSGKIDNCEAHGEVNAKSSSGPAKAGGFVGTNYASINNCKAYSKNVYVGSGTFYNDNGCGGFVGKNGKGGLIESSRAESNVDTTKHKKGGGFVGEAVKGSTIKNSTCRSTIRGKALKKFCYDKSKKATIENCRAE